MGRQKVILWRFVLVGGQYDGVEGLRWRDAGEGVPDTILVGWCPGDGLCTASETECRALGHGKRHVAYWLPEEPEEDRPEQTSTYELEHEHVERDGNNYFRGIARYTVPGLKRRMAEEDRIEEDADARRRDPVYA